MKVIPEIYADGKRWVRVSMPTAKKAFEKGEEVAITTAKRDRFDGGLIPISLPLIVKYSFILERSFTRTINNFHYYNCSQGQNLMMFFVEKK